MNVRPAIAVDAPAIARIQVESWRAAYAHLLPPDFLAAMSIDRRAERWAEILASGASRTLVVVDDTGSVAGFASVSTGPDQTTGELQAIYLDPPRWDQGMGAALIREAEAIMVEAGKEEAVLWVFADNPRARRFYESAGWLADGAFRLEEIGGVQPEQVRYRKVLT